MFHWLLGLDKKLTGLTALQKGLLNAFAGGQSDSEAAQALGIGSTSTVRNHRFTLREKVKQAKLFLAVMELAEEKLQKAPLVAAMPLHQEIQVDGQPVVSGEENAEIISSYFKQGPDGPLLEFPRKHKRRTAILHQLIKRFVPGREYTEKEVNAILEEANPDYVTLRRYLIDHGLLDREEDGSRYWVRSQAGSGQDGNINGGIETMDKSKRKELGYNYAHSHRPMGVYRIYNSVNGKSLVGSSMNLDGAWNKHKFMLDAGLHDNKALQADWKTYGADAVTFEVLEQIKPEEEFIAEASETLKYRKPLAEMEERWLEKLAPYGENGYHRQK
ncbi:DUF2087 domain-containing protein [Paenibacillus tengchongensis]|uniref:DUF2087 domain-containing protein n=1 Tax=Paenibacillus tengchongensis TaxID=2608684 RepID=UPI001FE5D665|nr:DUF2087 domain-containing protein [Paenibacillus tengchongensis]